MANLAKRRAAPNDKCPICDEEVETSEHMLFFCQHAVATWFMEDLGYKLKREGFISFEVWWCQFTDDFKGPEFEPLLTKIALTCWHIWKTRNETVFRKARPCPESTNVRIINHFSDWAEAMKGSENDGVIRRNEERDQQWQPLPPGTVKFNCDVAWRQDTYKAWGAIKARNCFGAVIDGRTCKFKCNSATISKAIILREACMF